MEEALIKDAKGNMLSNMLQGGAYLSFGNIMRHLANGNQIIHDNGNAFFFSGFGYSLYNTFFQPILEVRLSPKTAKMVSAGFAFAGCSLMEIIQSFNLDIVKNNPNWIGSVYDPKDFLAYALGVGSALTLNLLIDYSRNKSKSTKRINLNISQ